MRPRVIRRSMMLETPSRLSDTQLAEELSRLAGRARTDVVALITHLAEFDARRLYLPASFSSMFQYCREVLRLSEHETYHRILAARTARKYPDLLPMLSDGSVNLTTIRLLAPHLTVENHGDLLSAARGKSRRQVEEIVGRRFPQAQADAHEIRFMASAATCAKLQAAQDLLRHAVPTGDVAEIVDRALTALVEDLVRKKFAVTPRARTGGTAVSGTRQVPAAVRR